jgi:hypothetical protein
MKIARHGFPKPPPAYPAPFSDPTKPTPSKTWPPLGSYADAVDKYYQAGRYYAPNPCPNPRPMPYLRAAHVPKLAKILPPHHLKGSVVRSSGYGHHNAKTYSHLIKHPPR